MGVIVWGAALLIAVAIGAVGYLVSERSEVKTQRTCIDQNGTPTEILDRCVFENPDMRPGRAN